MPQMLHQFIRRYLIPTALTAQEKQFLLQFRSLSGSYSDFASILEAYPDKKFTLLQLVNTKFKSQLKETVTSTNQALNFLGFIPSRNIVLYSILNKNIKVSNFSDKEITQLLAYASIKKGIKQDFQQEYFIAGLAFDIAKISIHTSNPSLPEEEIQSLFDEVWSHGLITAKIAFQLQSHFVPTLGLQKAVILDALLHDIGRLFLPFLKKEPPNLSEKSPPTLPGQSLQNEKSQFDYSHDIIGYLFLTHLGFVAESSKIALHHHHPYLAYRFGNLMHTRALILWLADHLHKYRIFHKTTLYHPDIIKSWYKGVHLSFTNFTLEQFSGWIRGLDFSN